MSSFHLVTILVGRVGEEKRVGERVGGGWVVKKKKKKKSLSNSTYKQSRLKIHFIP